MKKMFIYITALLLILSFHTQAQPNQDGTRGGQKPDRPNCDALKQAHQENMKARKEHRADRKEQRADFREQLEDMEPGTRMEAIMAHRKRVFNASKNFHKKLFQNISSALKDCDEIPAERRQQMLSKLQKHHQAAVAFHSGIHKEVMSFLNELKNSDMEPAERKAAWEEFHHEIEAKVAAWRSEHDHKGRRGDGPRGDGQGGQNKNK